MGLLDIFKRPEKRSNMTSPKWMKLMTQGGESVSEESVLKLSAVWSCVRILSETIAGLPINVMQKSDDVMETLPTHPAARLVKFKPNKMHTSFTYRELIVAHAVLHGNHYSIIVRNGNADPIELLPLHPKDVEVVVMENELYYNVKLGDDTMTMPADNILHIAGLGFDGKKGKSVIKCHAENLGLSLSAQKYGKEFYDSGTKLDGYIKMPGKFDPSQLEKIRESWSNTYGGVSGGKTAILDGGSEYQQLGLPPEDAQYIGTRQFQKTEIATIFRVPSHMINDLDRATHNNIEHQAIEFVMYSLLPWINRIEQEFNRKLLRANEQGNVYFKMNTNGLLRGDAAARAEFYFKMEQMGVMSINEIRRLEDLNPIENGGEHFVPLNRIALSQAKEFYSNQNGE
jgi:HK97 family phage portal protein